MSLQIVVIHCLSVKTHHNTTRNMPHSTPMEYSVSMFIIRTLQKGEVGRLCTNGLKTLAACPLTSGVACADPRLREKHPFKREKEMVLNIKYCILWKLCFKIYKQGKGHFGLKSLVNRGVDTRFFYERGSWSSNSASHFPDRLRMPITVRRKPCHGWDLLRISTVLVSLV